MADGNVEGVVGKLRLRSTKGKLKYGTTTEREDLDVIDWLNHVQEEMMDAAVYLERVIRELADRGQEADRG